MTKWCDCHDYCKGSTPEADCQGLPPPKALQPRDPGDDPETPAEAEAEGEKERIAQNLESILAEEADYLGLIKQAMLREAAAYIRKLP